MREFAKVSPHFWINENERKQLGWEAQLTALYLLTNPHANMIGIYYLPTSFIAHEIGIPLEAALKGLEGLIKIRFCSYDDFSEYVWVRDMAFSQLGRQLKPNDNRVKAINETYAGLPELPFLQAFYEQYAKAFFLEKRLGADVFLLGAIEALTSKEKEKEKEKEKKIFMSGKPDVVLLDSFSLNEELEQTSLKSQALQILQFLNEKTGRAYRPVDANLKLIIARLASGATLRDCFQIIAKKTREWKGHPKMAEYLRPATLFNLTKFEQYVGELVVAKQARGIV